MYVGKETKKFLSVIQIEEDTISPEIVGSLCGLDGVVSRIGTHANANFLQDFAALLLGGLWRLEGC